MTEAAVPLVVDLDGTLINTDMLVETASAFVGMDPRKAVRVVSWLSKGKVCLKRELANATTVDVAVLPYNDRLLTWLQTERASGRPLVLATASHRLLAERIARHLGLFDDVLATDGDRNLKGERKRALLVEKYGERGYDYVGNDRADIQVWKSSRHAYVVSGSERLLDAASSVAERAERICPPGASWWSSILRVMRPHQWAKNGLLLIPLFTAHAYGSLEALVASCIGMVSFCLAASSAYVLNDALDVEHDRHHPRKRNRPFASGRLSLAVAWGLAPALLFLSFGFALMLPPGLGMSLAAYYALTVAYSLVLKRMLVVDVLTLAGLYTLRLIAGAEAIAVPLSFWLLSFSMFLFLSLALLKRYSEIVAAHADAVTPDRIRGRGYYPRDAVMVAALGASAAYLAVMVLALYIQDPATTHLYHSPRVIWLSCPLLLYWLSRAWIIAHRGHMHDDPVVFALSDRASLVVGGLLVLVFAAARLL